MAAQPERTVVEILALAIGRSRKSQRLIASEIGYRNANVITMFKQGLTKVPIPIAPHLARALDIDPAYFTRTCMQEYMPELLETVEKTFGPLELRH